MRLATSVFFSFHYDRDYWRVQQIRNIGALAGQQELSPQAWEAVRRQGNAAIEGWIDRQMSGTSAVVVLVGTETAQRRWVDYEIRKAWNEKRPLVGIRIHALLDSNRKSSAPGPNPFVIGLGDGSNMSDFVSLHDPSGHDSKSVFADITTKITTWVSNAYRRR